MEFEIKSLQGDNILPYLDELARLRISIFRDFPYLYEGSREYEERYLRTYAAHKESLIVLALHEGHVIGASTGVPLEQETQEVQQPFIQHGLEVSKYFYFGESVLEKRFRGYGLGNRFFVEREAYARSINRFTFTTFCAVQRPPDHPLAPLRYRPLDAFWQRRGYSKHPELTTKFKWRDVGEAHESEKTMMFWSKPLSSNL